MLENRAEGGSTWRESPASAESFFAVVRHMASASVVSAPPVGLSQEEAAARRARGQGNTMARGTSRTYARLVRDNVLPLVNNIFYVLGVALVALGRYSDALVSVGVVLINVLVSLVQEIRAKRTLDRIALLTRPKATVIRDGSPQAVGPQDIVLGDVLEARPGDQLVVDGTVVGAGSMACDESLLTGESEYVAKRAGDPVYAGSFCVTGSARYEATKVGGQSLAGQITEGARAFRRVTTPLQRDLNLLIRSILLVALFLEVLLAALAAIDNASVAQGVQISVVIVGLVPNGLLVAVAVAYGLGAVRIARHGALVQQANAVESLASVDVLCLDKTGTLTANKIVLHAVRPLAGTAEADLRRLLGDFAASTPAGNRTSEAIAAACPGQPRRLGGMIPFSSDRKWSALILDEPPQTGGYVLGAPEMLAPALPHDLDLQAAEEWAAQGLRVLLFAAAPGLQAPPDPEQASLPPDLQPLGLISFTDKLRPEARETLASFIAAGIRPKIISGDSPETVAALAKQAGLSDDIQAISGLELATLGEAEFAQRAEDATIFGRITPQQKQALVKALRGRGHYVAMIGDGTNDVLSLKGANLGIAMESGSQATRAVADIVLLGDSFAALPRAFAEGQKIVNGMRTNLKLFMTRVVFVALLIVAVGVLGGFPFAPKHASVLTLFTVGIPVIALAAWARPGPPERAALGPALLEFVVPAAVTLTLTALTVYLFYLPGARASFLGGSSLALAQSALTTVAVLGGLVLLVFVQPPVHALEGTGEASGDWRPTLLAIVLALLYAGILATPALREFFDLVPLSAGAYALIAALVAAWGLAMRFIWHAHLFERFLGLESIG